MLVQAEGPVQDLRSRDEEEIQSQQQAKKEGDTVKTQSDTQEHLRAGQKQVGLVVTIRGGGETVTSLNRRRLNQRKQEMNGWMEIK